MLKIDATKNYGHQRILQVESFYLQPGIYWVKGANGSGKTTLLKMISGLLSFDGDIACKNISLKKEPVIYRQNIGWAEAEPLYPEFLTGTNLVSLYRSIRKVSETETDRLINLFGMNDYISQPVGTYSTGMIKKLSLVLAFTGDTKLIVLDEPLITLDPGAFSIVCNLIAETHSTKGTGFLMSSHQDLDTQLLLKGKELTVANQTLSFT